MTKSYAPLAQEEERVVEAAARSKHLFLCVCFFSFLLVVTEQL